MQKFVRWSVVENSYNKSFKNWFRCRCKRNAKRLKRTHTIAFLFNVPQRRNYRRVVYCRCLHLWQQWMWLYYPSFYTITWRSWNHKSALGWADIMAAKADGRPPHCAPAYFEGPPENIYALPAAGASVLTKRLRRYDPLGLCLRKWKYKSTKG